MLLVIESFFENLYSELVFLFQRLTWTSALDILLVAIVIFIVLRIVRDTQAMVLLRGVLLIVIVLFLLTTLVNLPAFSWLVTTITPS